MKEEFVKRKVAIEAENVAIEAENVAIEAENVAIETLKFNVQTKRNICKLFEKVNTEMVFGRQDVSEICSISYAAAGNLIAKMKENSLIAEVKGYGKGKYRFRCILA